MDKKGNFKYIIGIDEVGRGPLAGPITFCAVCLLIKFPKSFSKGVRDSKKLSPKQREEWDKKIRLAEKAGKLEFVIASISAEIIDKKGLSFAGKFAIKKILKKLGKKPKEVLVLLDGGLHAEKEFISQETIIKGDEKIPAISLASILAKVYRDKKMVNFSKKFPQYGFDIHKGYGTKKHIKAIQKYGISSIHRKSFLKGILSF